jgi:pteridine reductase
VNNTEPDTPPVALITGGARRIGAAITRELHAAGCRVLIHYHRSAGAAEALRDECNARRPDSAAIVSADLLDTPALTGLVERALEAWGRLDVLVNNASTFYPTPVGDIEAHHWDELMGTNARAPLFLAQAAAPHLTGTGGCIVNLIDIHAERPMRRHVVYSAAKSALAALTRSLARELAPAVRVNGVAPGAILWPEDGIEPATRASIVERIALKRPGEPGDVAGAVRYLALEAGYITGHIMPVDGGRGLMI